MSSVEPQSGPLERGPVRVLIVDDHEMTRVGLKTLFRKSAKLRVVGEADSIATAFDEAMRLHPDVILMDVRLPDGNGVEMCQELRARSPSSRVLFLTSFVDEATVISAILGGADGYLLKQIGRDALIQAILSVAEGQSVLDRAVTRPILAQMRSLAGKGKHELLSEQEQRVLALVSEGKTNKEIATILGLSDKTVKSYISYIFQKLQVTRRAQAAAVFSRRNPR